MEENENGLEKMQMKIAMAQAIEHNKLTREKPQLLKAKKLRRNKSKAARKSRKQNR